MPTDPTPREVEPTASEIETARDIAGYCPSELSESPWCTAQKRCEVCRRADEIAHALAAQRAAATAVVARMNALEQRLVAEKSRAELAEAALSNELRSAPEVRDKAMRFELDRLGIESREREAVELVELRAALAAAAEREREARVVLDDAVSALRYIEQSYGRHYGVGWDRVYNAYRAWLAGKGGDRG